MFLTMLAGVSSLDAWDKIGVGLMIWPIINMGLAVGEGK